MLFLDAHRSLDSFLPFPFHAFFPFFFLNEKQVRSSAIFARTFFAMTGRPNGSTRVVGLKGELLHNFVCIDSHVVESSSLNSRLSTYALKPYIRNLCMR